MEAMRAAALRVLLKCCPQELERVLRCNAAPEEHLGLPLSVISLADCEPELTEALFLRPLEVLSLLDDAAVQAQSVLKDTIEKQHTENEPHGNQTADAQIPLNVYDNVHVRLVGLPTSL
ncbi:hypothetical protein Agub_g9784, partial [Astrephomene gubernaculifera]